MDALGDRGSWGRLGLRTRLSKQRKPGIGEFFVDMSSMTKVRRTPFDLIALLWDLGAVQTSGSSVHGGLDRESLAPPVQKGPRLSTGQHEGQGLGCAEETSPARQV